ncbi:MAG: hypothetical protein LDL33_07885 [Desulfomonile sp.]|nr:hypothetical protein [Desulfomonile sp.]
MNSTDDLEELRMAIAQIRKDHDLLMTSLTTFADSVKTALIGTLNRETSLQAELAAIKHKLADLEARIERLDPVQ